MSEAARIARETTLGPIEVLHYLRGGLDGEMIKAVHNLARTENITVRQVIARLFSYGADELETRDATHAEEALTLAEAVVVSAYSEKHLRRLVDQGELEDVGTDGKLALRRGDLPRKVKARRVPSLAAKRLLGHHVIET